MASGSSSPSSQQSYSDHPGAAKRQHLQKKMQRKTDAQLDDATDRKQGDAGFNTRGGFQNQRDSGGRGFNGQSARGRGERPGTQRGAGGDARGGGFQ